MSFSRDSIGFMLELEDKLSPKLKEAGKNFTKFSKDLEKINAKTVKGANTAFAAMSSLAKSFASLPDQATKSYNRAYSALKRNIKPIKQPMEVIFSSKSFKNTFATAISKAIQKALSKVTIKMSPQIPKRRSKGFDTSENLKAAYRHVLQPPDMVGAMDIPKFKKGGIVKGGSREGIDDVLAALGKGEMILPAEYAKILQRLSGRSRIPKQLSQAFSDLQGLERVMDKMTQKSQTGPLSKAEAKLLKQAHKLSGPRGADLNAIVASLPKDMQAKLNGTLSATNKTLGASRTQSAAILKNFSLASKAAKAWKDAVTGIQKTLHNISTDTKYIAFMEFWKNRKSDMKDAKEHVANVLGTDHPVKDFFDNANSANRTWHQSRTELYGIRKELIGMMNDTPGVLDPTTVGEAVGALTEAGVRLDTMRKTVRLTALASQSMNMSIGTAAHLARVLSDNMHLDQKQTASTLLNISKVAENSNQSADEVAQHMLENRHNMGAAFALMDSKDQKSTLDNMARFGAAMSNNFADSNNHMATMMAKAMADETSDEAQQMRRLTNMTGSQLKKAFASGDIGSVMDAMGKTIDKVVESAHGDSTLLAKIAPILGFQDAGEMVNASRNRKGMNSDIDKMAKSFKKAGDPAKALADDAGKALSFWEKLGKHLTVFGYNWFQPIIDGMHEFNLASAIGYVWIGKKLFGGLLNIKKLLSLGWLGKMGGWLFGAGAKDALTGTVKGVGWLRTIGSMLLNWGTKLLPLIVTGFTMVAGVIGPMLVPVLAIATAIGSIVFLSYQVWKYWDDIKSIFNGGLFKDIVTLMTANKGPPTQAEIDEFKKGVPERFRHKPTVDYQHIIDPAMDPINRATKENLDKMAADRAAAQAKAPDAPNSDTALMQEQNGLLKSMLGVLASGKQPMNGPMMPGSGHPFMSFLQNGGG